MREQFPKEEPAADLRGAAQSVRQMFVALCQAGFTERQALTIVGDILKGSMQ